MKKKYYLLFLLLIPIIIIVGRSFALPISSEIKTIEINSDNYDNAGSFNIKKTVDWKEKGKAEITYTVKTIEKNTNNNYKDIVLVIDTSNSMNDGKLEKVRNDSIELIRSLLNDLNNRVALITFNNNATIKSDFTNNKEELESLLNTLTISNKANFNNALLKVNELLNNYDNLDNHDLVVLFLTDGNPNEGMPNDKATYGMLKDKYQNIVINAVQYEEEKGITDGIKNISDNQFLVSDRNILTEAMLTSIPYEKFNIVDIINNSNFTINSNDDIKVNNGTVELKTENGNQVINWNLANTKSGVTSTMKVIINLNSNLINQNDLYKTNNGTTISYKLKEESEKSLTSDKTLLLKNKYNVNYDLNKPSNCNLDSISSESHFVGDIVSKKTQSLYCDGYIVKSWEIKGEDNISVKTINSSAFLMPSTDITVRAVWAKNGIVKSMDGVVYERANTLYRVLQDAAVEGTYAKEYTGPHQDSNTKVGTKKIYHWYADQNDSAKGAEISNMNYVKFGKYCWQMIRTTDTGGVRLLYKGIYDDTTKCQSVNSYGLAYGYYNTTMWYDSNDSYYNYYYGTDFTFDEETHQFELAGNVIQAIITEDTADDFIGMFTCRSNTNSSCSYLYRITSKKNEHYVNATELYYSSYIYQSIGYGYIADSVAQYSMAAGSYMYGDIVYGYSSYDASSNLSFGSSATLIEKMRFDSSYYVSDEIEKSYTSGNTQYYRLKNPVSMSNFSSPTQLIGKYWVTYKNNSFAHPDVIADIDDYNFYYLKYYSSENDINGNTIYHYYDYNVLKIGDSITDNGDGTYTLNNVVEVSFHSFMPNRNNYIGKYICKDGETTCDNPWKINSYYCYECDGTYAAQYGSRISVYYKDANENILIAKNRNGNQLIDTLVVNKYDLIDNMSNYSEYHYTCGNLLSTCNDDNIRIFYGGYNSSTSAYLSSINNKYYYGSSVTWDGTKYTLVDPKEFEVFMDVDLFSHHHFTCLSPKQTSCEQVAYIYYTNIPDKQTYGSSYIYGYYILLKNGEMDVKAIFNSMINDNIHDSFAKSTIDLWYSKNMTQYTDYLEDSIYCNNRDINMNGWDPDGGKINVYDYGKTAYYNYDEIITVDIKCNREIDRFSMDNPKAKLTYPVGLMSYDEMLLLGNNNARNHSIYWHTMTPTYSASYPSMIYVSTSGYIGSSSGSEAIVPAITLKYDTEYISGDGSVDDPYIVDTSEVDGQ